MDPLLSSIALVKAFLGPASAKWSGSTGNSTGRHVFVGGLALFGSHQRLEPTAPWYTLRLPAKSEVFHFGLGQPAKISLAQHSIIHLQFKIASVSQTLAQLFRYFLMGWV